MILTIVAAVATDGCIGRAGGLPWRLPSDLRRFRALTMGKPVIMGRRTWDSLPRRPLPERFNIVLSRTTEQIEPTEDTVVCLSLEEALETVRGAPEVMVIGGAEIYALALPWADQMLLTTVSTTVPDGDAFFPHFDATQWKETSRERSPDLDFEVSYVTLTRNGSA